MLKSLRRLTLRTPNKPPVRPKLRALFALIVCIGLGLTYALWTSTNDTAPTNVVSKVGKR